MTPSTPATPRSTSASSTSATSTAHNRERTDLPTHFRIQAWDDPVVDNLGHDPRSRYVETYWLGVLGPTTTWLLRRIADGLDRHPEGFDLDLHATAYALGLGMRQGRHSPFMRAVDRACQFAVARRVGASEFHVRRRIPPVTQGQLKRLPDHLQRSHDAWRRSQLVAAGEEAERKARRLALTLLELGEDIDAAERQLCTWRVEEPMAQRALAWAHDRHRAAMAAAEAAR